MDKLWIQLQLISMAMNGGMGMSVPVSMWAPEVKGAAVVTDSSIKAALQGSEMQTVQQSVSKPAVERYVRRLEAGEVAPAIKVDGKVIVDGNTRYVAGRLAGKEPAQTPGSLSPSQQSKVQPVQNLKIDPVDHGNH